MIDFAKAYKFCKNDLVNYLPFPIFFPFFTREEVIDEFLKKPHRFTPQRERVKRSFVYKPKDFLSILLGKQQVRPSNQKQVNKFRGFFSIPPFFSGLIRGFKSELLWSIKIAEGNKLRKMEI